MQTLLVEIGTEEIPAGYIEPALNALASMLGRKLDDARIDHGAAFVYGTPRRLTVRIEQVADKQRSLSTEVLGPSVKDGFDAEGKPTVAAERFAEKVGVSVASLNVKQTAKGDYLCAQKTERGLQARTILKEMLPRVILSTPFPKTMRWAELDIAFARPIHWVLALLGGQTIPFEIGGLKSGRHTAGHYFMHRGKIKISDPEAYVDALRSADVLVDLRERKKKVLEDITRAAKAAGGSILQDDELLDTVTNLVEYPVATAGNFEDEFLQLPREILITAMREHQKYFAVVDDKGDLLPCFIAVNNTRTRDPGLVAKGHERVLRARLKDAQFFYRSDLDISSEERVEKLKGVLFQAELGTVHEKVLRVGELAGYLSEAAGQRKTVAAQVLRAAHLCKADLVSHVVGEFPKLQGVMGRVYAALSGEKEDVPAAIEEHYRPTYSGGALPETLPGAILSIADKMDSICGCFSVGLLPTGASDPYALRRQAIGIIQIVLDRQLTTSLRNTIQRSVELFGGRKGGRQTLETTDKVYTFFENRIAHLLAEEGFSKDVIAAVTSASVDVPPDVWQRVRALEKLKADPDFEPLATAFKRVVNIIRKAKKSEFAALDPKRFEDPSEKALHRSCTAVQKKVARHLNAGRFTDALLDIATLRDPVDRFFEDVLVMTDDVTVRRNRLALLREIADLFAGFADFSKLST